MLFAYLFAPSQLTVGEDGTVGAYDGKVVDVAIKLDGVCKGLDRLATCSVIGVVIERTCDGFLSFFRLIGSKGAPLFFNRFLRFTPEC